MSELEKKYPKAGVGVMIRKDGKLLLAKRTYGLGAGTYCWPGGHLEYMESFEDCIRREAREEAGVEVKNIRFLRLLNLKMDGRHYVDLSFEAEWAGGEPKRLEPDKFEEWAWYDMNDLPSPLFPGEEVTLDALKTGHNFYDA